MSHNITVERQSDDGLKRIVWIFSSVGGFGLRLWFYGEQERLTKRHAWRGPFWDASDERRYHSKLDRPTCIPDDIALEALRLRALRPVDFYIGWTNHESLSRRETVESLSRGKAPA